MPVLQFKGKTAIESYHYTVPHHVVEFDARLSLLGNKQKPGLDGNLIIEGDNLLALKALLPTHAGRIKCAYLDPPYNTGDEGWVFNDNLTQPQFREWLGQTVGKEGDDATRHDKWCCMIYPRLALVKELLADDGVLLVSIDEHEVHNLRLLLFELFGAENCIETIVWQKSYGGGAKSKHFVHLHEYILCFAKDKTKIGRLALPPDPNAVKYYKYEDDRVATRGKYRTQPLWTNSMDDRKNLRYPIPYKGEEVWPEKQWQWSEDRALEALEDDELVFVEGEGSVSVYYKQYRFDEDGVERGAKPYSIIEGIYTQQGTNELEQIFTGKAPFKFPKPSALIKHLLQIFTKDDDIVLDSFAGSGTTAHAVLALNSEDQAKRQFILVQMPNDSKRDEATGFNICRDVTIERVRRVISGYQWHKKAKKGKSRTIDVPGLGGTFSAARLGKSLFTEYRDFGKTPPDFKELAKYIFYTETSRGFDPAAVDETTGKIGEHKGTSYYLLYTPDPKKDCALDMEWLAWVAAAEKNRRIVVYCEKIWVHRDDLARFEINARKTVRPMLVPLALK
jgi:adenine-specific DNA-methyltransferase